MPGTMSIRQPLIRQGQERPFTEGTTLFTFALLTRFPRGYSLVRVSSAARISENSDLHLESRSFGNILCQPGYPTRCCFGSLSGILPRESSKMPSQGRHTLEQALATRNADLE